MKRDVCIGRTRGGKNTKIHALVNREGIPVCLLISAGNCADCDQAIPLLQKFGKMKGSNILGDRAYRYDKRADSFQAFLFLAASAVIFSILHI